jgi:hypothetical protein
MNNSNCSMYIVPLLPNGCGSYAPLALILVRVEPCDVGPICCIEHVNFKGSQSRKKLQQSWELDDENVYSLSSLERTQPTLLTAHPPNINMPPINDKHFCFICFFSFPNIWKQRKIWYSFLLNKLLLMMCVCGPCSLQIFNHEMLIMGILISLLK